MERGGFQFATEQDKLLEERHQRITRWILTDSWVRESIERRAHTFGTAIRRFGEQVYKDKFLEQLVEIRRLPMLNPFIISYRARARCWRRMHQFAEYYNVTTNYWRVQKFFKACKLKLARCEANMRLSGYE